MEKTPDTDLYKFEYAFPTICGEFYSTVTSKKRSLARNLVLYFHFKPLLKTYLA